MYKMEKLNQQVYVVDIETCASVFTYTALNIDTEEVIQYCLHEDKFELDDFMSHLNECKGQITFNGLNFDYPVMHFIMDNYNNWKNIDKKDIIKQIYNKSQDIITQQNKRDFKGNTTIREKNWKIRQLDLFRLWHYNNPARSTSLKSLAISMNCPDVMDMPIDFRREDIRLDELDQILEYNLLDVKVTYEFYKKSLDKINLRKEIKSKYGLACANWNNGKIGEQLILKLYCDKLQLDEWEVKQLRTNRSSINLKDCIPDNIKFESKEFNKLLDFFKSKTIKTTKGAINHSVIYKQHIYDYGTGGLHGIHRPGLYESDDKYIIKSADVASLYPNLAIVYGFSIDHLGDDFLDIYSNDIVGVRMKEKAKPKDQQNKSIIDGFKEAANIPYGKSNDENSFLYDPLYTMKTTIAGQLVLTMLCEKLAGIPDSLMLLSNTKTLVF